MPRDLDDGPPRLGPGGPKPYDGHVPWAAVARCVPVASGDEGIVLDTLVVNAVQGTGNVRVVVAVDTSTNRSAVLGCTAIARAAARRYREDNARFQSACLCRDAKQ